MKRGPGCWLDDEGAHLRVTAAADVVEVVLHDGTAPLRMDRRQGGEFSIDLPGRRFLTYSFLLDGRGPFADPIARELPWGMDGPAYLGPRGVSEVDPDWRGVPPSDLVIVEVHVGTATPEGTFEALLSHLQHWRDLGATALELMPITTLPGRWGWGYDAIQLFAPDARYGGPEGLRRLVNAAHANGLAVLLDVVYNHLGPVGATLPIFRPEAVARDRPTPWGDALDVRVPAIAELVIQNAEYWIQEFGLDGLRLDATHALTDDRFLADLARRARIVGKGRQIHVFAEDDRNDARLLREDGLALDGTWVDDLHHSLHVAVTGDRHAWLADYDGSSEELARTLQQGWLFDGGTSRYLGRPRGTSSAGVGCAAFIHSLQNHDQIGHHPTGERLGRRIDVDTYKAASAIALLTPGTPLLFMGQEWNAQTPFHFFADLAGPLGERVRAGRQAELDQLVGGGWRALDPCDPATRDASRLDWTEPSRAPHDAMLRWYRALVALRHENAALRYRDRSSVTATARGPRAIGLVYRGDPALELVVSFDAGVVTCASGATCLFHSDEERFGGTHRISCEPGGVRFGCAGAAVLRAPAGTSGRTRSSGRRS